MPTNAKECSPANLGKLDAWVRQESTFCVLHLIVLAVLLLVHTLFAEHFGVPSRMLVAVLAGAFLIRVLQLIWVQGRWSAPSERQMLLMTGGSVLLNLTLAFVAAVLTDRADAQYFVLLAMPVVEAAFRFSISVTTVVIVASGALNFLWLVRYAQKHGSVLASEYFEAGTISMIYAFVGALVWMLVNSLRANQAELARNLLKLEHTKEQLLREEKLAAIGRLSSAISHEIRNPVAMISSSLATAIRGKLEPAQRERMFEIASLEAARLEKVTNDFLMYARPRPSAQQRSNLAEFLGYVVELSRANAAKHEVTVEMRCPEVLSCDFDSALLQQTLLNLVMNAIDAAPAGATVSVAAHQSGNAVQIDVSDPGAGIDAAVLEHIFEPFFTTKPAGTGLGLAIARNAARAHSGDLTLTRNGPDGVTFTVTLPVGAVTLAGEVS